MRNHIIDRGMLIFLFLIGFAISISGLLLATHTVILSPDIEFPPMLIILLGVWIIISSGWSIRSKQVKNSWIWTGLISCLLLFGVAIRVVELTYDTLNYDEYRLMMNVQESFTDYIRELLHNHSIQYPAHYWLSYRVFGGSLFAYRSLASLASIALLLLTPIWINRFWPEKKVLYLVVVTILVLNANALRLSTYLFAYSNTFLLSASMFFLFMRLVQGPLKNKYWMWIGLLLIPSAFFSNVFLIIPLATCAFSMIIFRWRQSDKPFHFRLWLGWIWELKFLLIFPIAYLIQQIVFPVTLWGADKRLDQVHQYFPSCGLPSSPGGIVQYIATRTFTLFDEMLVPAGIQNSESLSVVFTSFCGVLVVIAIVQLLRQREDQNTAFAAFFLITSLLLLILAGVIGVYPYGAVRYIPFLSIPTMILIGIGCYWVSHWIFQGFGLIRTRTVILLFLCITVLIAGSYIIISRIQDIERIEKGNTQALNWLRVQTADLILADNYLAPMLYTRTPELYDRIHLLGWGVSLENDNNNEMINSKSELELSNTANRILLITFPHEFYPTDTHEDFPERYPAWSNLLNTHYDVESSVEGLHIRAELYQKK